MERQLDRNLIVATYNAEGQLEGPYHEYYFNGANHRAFVKWEGRFAIVSYSYAELEELTLKPTGKQLQTTHSIRSGIWSHYNRAGELLETVTYEWKKK